ncbi:MAG: hypothetical protein ABIF71_05550 [Planctomycetota bacterium]
MSIEFNCGACGKDLKVDDKHAGRKLKCPACKQGITVPSVSVEKKYLIKTADGSIGPIGFLDVADMVNKGTLKALDMVCIFGTERWKAVRDWPEFMALARLASQKMVVVKAKSALGLALKLAAIVAVISGFFIGMHWYTDSRVAARENRVIEILAGGNRAAIGEAQAEYELIKAEYPENPRVARIAEVIRQAEEDQKKREMADFARKRKEIEAVMEGINALVAGHDFQGALQRVREIRKAARACENLSITDNPGMAKELADFLAMPDTITADITVKWREFVLGELRKVDELTIIQEFKDAKVVLRSLDKVSSGLESDLTDMIAKKGADLTRLSRGESVSGDETTAGSGGGAENLSANLAQDLDSEVSATRLKGLNTVVLAAQRLTKADRDAFLQKAPRLLDDKVLFYPTLDAIMAVGDDGKLFGKIFEGFSRFVLYGKTEGMEKPCRAAKEFVPAVVNYGIKYGGLDKEDFLGGLAAIPEYAVVALEVMGGALKAADVPNLRNRIEKVIMESADDKTVTAAIRALGRMKSDESLEMLLFIIDYTTCTKCSIGTGDSGHKYMYQNLFCAKCRQGKEYTRDGSIFVTALEAVRAIGSGQALAALKKLAEREKTSGNTVMSDQIGAIVESLKK